MYNDNNVKYLPIKRRKGRDYTLTYKEVRALGASRGSAFILSRRLSTLIGFIFFGTLIVSASVLHLVLYLSRM